MVLQVMDLYVYMAKVLKHRDADTIEVDLDLGLYVHIRAALRLLDVDAPEVVGEHKVAGVAATVYLQTLIPVGSTVLVQTFKRQNADRYVQTFDRFVARVWGADGLDVNEAMREWLRANAPR